MRVLLAIGNVYFFFFSFHFKRRWALLCSVCVRVDDDVTGQCVDIVACYSSLRHFCQLADGVPSQFNPIRCFEERLEPRAATPNDELFGWSAIFHAELFSALNKKFRERLFAERLLYRMWWQKWSEAKCSGSLPNYKWIYGKFEVWMWNFSTGIECRYIISSPPEILVASSKPKWWVVPICFHNNSTLPTLHRLIDRSLIPFRTPIKSNLHISNKWCHDSAWNVYDFSYIRFNERSMPYYHMALVRFGENPTHLTFIDKYIGRDEKREAQQSLSPTVVRCAQERKKIISLNFINTVRIRIDHTQPMRCVPNET